MFFFTLHQKYIIQCRDLFAGLSPKLKPYENGILDNLDLSDGASSESSDFTEFEPGAAKDKKLTKQRDLDDEFDTGTSQKLFLYCVLFGKTTKVNKLQWMKCIRLSIIVMLSLNIFWYCFCIFAVLINAGQSCFLKA